MPKPPNPHSDLGFEPSNFNPGNITGPDGKILEFQTPEVGWNRLRQDLRAKTTGNSSTGITPESTFAQLGEVYAPRKDKRNQLVKLPDGREVTAWSKNTADKLGVSVDTPIGQYAGKIDDLAQAVAHAEGTTKIPFVPADAARTGRADMADKSKANPYADLGFTPGKYDDLGFTPTPSSSRKPLSSDQDGTPAPTSPIRRVIGNTAADFLSGVGGSALNSLKGVATLAERGSRMGMPGGPIETALESPQVKPYVADLPSTAGKIGRVVEQTAEFMLPGPAEAKLASNIGEVVPRGLQTIAKAAASAGTTGAITTAQSGGDARAAAVPAALAGGTTIVGAVLSKPIAALGRKIQASTIRPRLSDKRDGFSWDTVKQLGLKGNLEQSLNQVDSKLNELRTARNNLIKPGSANVDLHEVFDQALADVSKEAVSLGYGPMGKKAMEQITNMRADVADLLGAKTLQGLPVDVSKAENLKEFLGTLGSWSYGRGDPDAKVTELVANTLYSKVRQGIEKSLGSQGPQVKALNAQMQKIIPVKNAMMARLPVEERNRLFSLTDIAAMLPAVATGDARLLALEGLTRAQKSLRFGNWLNRGLPQGAGRMVGGAAQVASPWVVPPMP